MQQFLYTDLHMSIRLRNLPDSHLIKYVCSIYFSSFIFPFYKKKKDETQINLQYVDLGTLEQQTRKQCQASRRDKTKTKDYHVTRRVRCSSLEIRNANTQIILCVKLPKRKVDSWGDEVTTTGKKTGARQTEKRRDQMKKNVAMKLSKHEKR